MLIVFLWLTVWVGVVWYLLDENMKKSAFVKYHLKQFLIVLIATVIGWIAATVLSVILIGLVLWAVLAVLDFVWFVQAMLYTFKEEEKPLFLVGKYAEQLFKF